MQKQNRLGRYSYCYEYIALPAQMGYNQHCVISTCAQNCCNFYGNCVNATSAINEVRFCYYFYGRDITNAEYETITALMALVWVMVAIAVAIIFATLFLLLFCKTKTNMLLNHESRQAALVSKQDGYLPYSLKLVMQRERGNMSNPPALKTPIKQAPWSGGDFYRSINNLYKQSPDQNKKLRFYASKLQSLAAEYETNRAI